MKKIASLLSLVLVVSMLVPMASNAGKLTISDIPPISLPYASPTVDAVINADEGWSLPENMNEETCGHLCFSEMVASIDIYFAYDDNGIYFAADITDNGSDTGFYYSTGTDDIDSGEIFPSGFGYNGDVFIFQLDPNAKFMEYRFDATMDYAPWYCVGLFEEEGGRMFRCNVDDGDITDEVQVAAVRTDDGWRLEACLPWEMVIEDTYNCSYGEISLTKDELTTPEMYSKAACMYHDRFMEGGEVQTLGSYITMSQYCEIDGMASLRTPGYCVKTFGLKLYTEHKYKGAYNDINENAWYYNAFAYMAGRGLMSGTGGGTFSPGGDMTRAMFVTVLGRVEGIDTSRYQLQYFDDAIPGSWYTPFVVWAYRSGITEGIGNGLFGVNQAVTREQIAVFMQKYAEICDYPTVTRTTALTSFDDYASVDSWAYDALEWAVNAGLIAGNDNKLMPRNTATRAQVAQIIMKFCMGMK